MKKLKYIFVVVLLILFSFSGVAVVAATTMLGGCGGRNGACHGKNRCATQANTRPCDDMLFCAPNQNLGVCRHDLIIVCSNNNTSICHGEQVAEAKIYNSNKS